MIVALRCALSLCCTVSRKITMVLIHGNKHQNLVKSLDISSQVVKLDFFVARATSKTYKNIFLIPSPFV